MDFEKGWSFRCIKTQKGTRLKEPPPAQCRSRNRLLVLDRVATSCWFSTKHIRTKIKSDGGTHIWWIGQWYLLQLKEELLLYLQTSWSIFRQAVEEKEEISCACTSFRLYATWWRPPRKEPGAQKPKQIMERFTDYGNSLVLLSVTILCTQVNKL